MRDQVAVSIYQLKGGQFQASYTNPFTTKRVRAMFRTSKEAEDFQRKIQVQFLTDVLTGFSHLPVGQFLDEYLKLGPKAKIVSRGLPFYLSFRETFGKMSVMDVTATSLDLWLKQIKEERGYAQRTLPNIKSAFNHFFLYLIDRKIIRENPLDKVRIRRGPTKRERTHLSKEELADLLSKIKTLSPTQVHPVCYFLAHTGCRLGEALKLKWNEVDLNMGTVKILESKTGEGRLLHISGKLLEFLKNHPRIVHIEFVNHRSVILKVAFEKQT
ncbi:MAG: tyrosine-type recombinase/integrase [Bdellovibrionaceae bacterium]|nr:tyrosine-type recombinase/integrase [Pseudobdellovibrionaceae bacterium]